MTSRSDYRFGDKPDETTLRRAAWVLYDNFGGDISCCVESVLSGEAKKNLKDLPVGVIAKSESVGIGTAYKILIWANT